MGQYDKVKWLIKLHEILQKNNKIGIGDKSFRETEKNTIKRMLMYFNDQVKEVVFAWEPIQELNEEEVEEIL